ncbi:glycosyltransferase family 39 protein [Paenibacillus silviterrae]|uniref:glycosyltransferase family 39 protein n=1 Tax=Paenibacillus silviterrae TaxID=3242194 RepID=UPI002543912F|nr:glycosyltransferase family 39 protein [Paenibacillus chinjuensis]
MNRWLHIFHKYKDKEFIYIIPIVLMSIKVRLDYVLYRFHSGKGIPYSDDSQWYLNYASALMNNWKIGLHMNDILYLGYNLLLTLLMALFKDPKVVVIIQAVTAGLSVVLVYQIARILFNRLTAIIASLFFYDIWGITMWASYILTDSFFISLLLLCIYLLLMAFETKKKAYFVLFIVFSIYMLVFRPTGVVSLAFILFYIMYRKRLNVSVIASFIKKHKYIVGSAAALLAAVSIYLVAGHKLTPLIASIQFNAKMVLYNIYAKGWIYDRASSYDYAYRPDYRIDIMNSLVLSYMIHNWDHIMVLYGRRVIAFLGMWVWKTDVTHVRGIVKLFYNLLPTFLFIVGTVAAIVNGIFRRTSIIWFTFFAVFAFCIVLFIDGMYRYKAPALPFIAIAAGYGAERLLYLAYLLAKQFSRKPVGKLVQLWDKKTNCDWLA